MHSLTQDQIELVERKVKEQEISYSHLKDDLLDHICCDIELQMQSGKDFRQASNNIYKRFGLNGLKEIQEATIFYVKFNLLIMKKLMNVLALVGSILFVLGSFFKMMHWPGGSALFFFGSVILFMGFFPVALLGIRKELNTSFFAKGFLSYIIGFVSLLITGAAIVFSMMHWPGTSYMILASWIMLLFFFFPMIFYKVIRLKKNRIIYLTLSIFAFALICYTAVSGYNQNTSLYKLIEYINDEKELNYYQAKINSMHVFDDQKSQFSDDLNVVFDPLEQNINDFKRFYLGDKQDIYDATLSFLHHSSFEDRYGKRLEELKQLINNYQRFALTHASNDPILQQLINDKLSTSSVDMKYLGQVSWYKRFVFSRRGKESVYINLNALHKDIYLVQLELMRAQNQKTAPEL